MKELPILFSAPMVLAILEDRKTQTRRIVKPQPVVGDEITNAYGEWMVGRLRDSENAFRPIQCPFGIPGDRLWVRETFSMWCHSFESVGIEYAAGGPDCIHDFPDKKGMPSLEIQCQKNIDGGRRKRPSIFMPRWASRITLEITGIRVERLQNISEGDAKAEGCKYPSGGPTSCYRMAYFQLWESINGKDSWSKNPWCWCLTFKKL